MRILKSGQHSHQKLVLEQVKERERERGGKERGGKERGGKERGRDRERGRERGQRD